MLPHRTNLTLLRSALVMLPLGLIVALLPFSAQAVPGGDETPDPVTHVGSSVLGTETSAQSAADAEVDYRAATERVRRLSQNSAALDVRADQATAQAEKLYDVVRDRDGGGLFSSLSNFVRGGDSDLDRATDASDNAQHATLLAASAADTVAAAIADSEQARIDWETALSNQRQLSAQEAARLAARTAAKQSQFHSSYLAETKAQDKSNRQALKRWLNYLDSLADSAIVPPTVEQMQDHQGPAEDLDPVRSASGRVIPGVLELDPAGTAPIVVLPAETVRAVAEAFSRVGLPNGADSTGPAAYACGGFTARAWSAAATSVPADSMAQWRELHAVSPTDLQVGDVVVLGNDDSGLTGSGIYLGANHAIISDAADGQTAVKKISMRQVYGARRATLPRGEMKALPDAANCGLVEDAAGGAPTGSGPLLLPVADGSYTLSSNFGDNGPLWSTGEHSGQDFAAALGTPVYAAAAGTVRIEKSGWAGTLVKINHGSGVETWYAHMSRVSVTDGQRLAAGDVIGAVGSEGNSTGPHLHFEIRLDGGPIDPMVVLVPTSFSATGSFLNGQLAKTSLCAATRGGAQLLRCDAAVGFRMMSAAFEDAMGTPLCITDSYRARASQEQVFKTKPGLAAVPGTSNHGWGVAADLCGGVERFGSPQHEWVAKKGPAYGWILPGWAGSSGSRPEPWHFEYAA